MKNRRARRHTHISLPDEIADGLHVETVLSLANELRAVVARVYNLPLDKVNIKIALSNATTSQKDGEEDDPNIV